MESPGDASSGYLATDGSFATRRASEWESILTRNPVACAEISQQPRWSTGPSRAYSRLWSLTMEPAAKKFYGNMGCRGATTARLGWREP